VTISSQSFILLVPGIDPFWARGGNRESRLGAGLVKAEVTGKGVDIGRMEGDLRKKAAG